MLLRFFTVSYNIISNMISYGCLIHLGETARNTGATHVLRPNLLSVHELRIMVEEVRSRVVLVP